MGNTKAFMDSVQTFKQGGANFSSWKDKGKTIGWIHPDGFHEHKLHGLMIMTVKDKDGKPVKVMKRPVCLGEKCPFDALMEWARGKVEMLDDGKDVMVLSGSIPARDRNSKDKNIAYSLKDLAGQGSWKRSLNAKTEFLFGWVPRDGRSAESPVELVNAGQGLANAIKGVIQSQMEERGETAGDPLVRPYAFKLIYRKDEAPQNMYAAERVDSDIAELTEEVKAILHKPLSTYGIDFEKFDILFTPAEILQAIEECWDCKDLEYSDFLAFYRSMVGEEKSEKDLDNPNVAKKFAEEVNKTAAKKTEESERPQGRKPAADSGKKMAYCPECKEPVEVSPKGRCKKCAEDLSKDVPF